MGMEVFQLRVAGTLPGWCFLYLKAKRGLEMLCFCRLVLGEKSRQMGRALCRVMGMCRLIPSPKHRDCFSITEERFGGFSLGFFL